MTDMANDLIIDFTFVEPTARTYGTYNKAGQAALKRKRKSKLSVNTGMFSATTSQINST